jgi:hypothetical protein
MQERNKSTDQVQVDMATEAKGKEKQSFTEPKLTYVAPKLIKVGSVEEITGGFFGPFYP